MKFLFRGISIFILDMKNLFTLLVLFLLVASCKNEISRNSTILNVEIGNLPVDFKELKNDNLTFIPLNLPDSIFFGGIDHIKAYADMIFLHDEGQTNSLTIIDENGKFINQLKKIGDGPGEYKSLDAFAYNENEKILTIYDRSKFSLFHYKAPSLEHISTYRLQKYIMNLEYVNDETIMIVSENEINEKGKYEGVMYISKEGKLLQDDLSIGNDVSSIELSYPNTVIKISDITYYAHPHELTTIYKMGNTAEPIYTIDFGKNKIPYKFWPVNKASEFEQSLTEGNKAVWVQNIILNEENLAFSFLYKEFDTRYFYHQNFKDSSVHIYKGYTVSNSDYTLPHPIGSNGRNFISLIYTENIDSTQFQNKEFLKTLRKSEGGGGYIIVKYKP
ncbi:MAG: hypothetical protein ACI83B_003774 [Sediminicola sp.]